MLMFQQESLDLALRRHPSGFFSIGGQLSSKLQLDSFLCAKSSAKASSPFLDSEPRFKVLSHLIQKILRGDMIMASDLSLSEADEVIFRAFLARKFQHKVLDNRENLLGFLNTLRTAGTSKRIEEQFKFVVKRIVKRMMERFAMETNCPRSSLEERFYAHYFDPVRGDKPLEKFFLPRPQVGFYKTFSKEYLFHLRSSPEFVAYFLKELDAFDIEQQLQRQVINMLENIGTNRANLRECPDKLSEYILTNKKCKLPWTKKEFQTARDNLRDIFATKTSD